MDNIKIRIKSGNNEFEAEGPSAEVEKHMEIWRREVSGLAKSPESADPTNAYYFDPGRDGLTLRKAPGIGPKGRKLADALLLIVACLGQNELVDLLGQTHSLGMTALVEVHDEADVEGALAAGAQVVGVNNRDLRTFQVDVATTRRLRPLIPPDTILVAESGIHSAQDAARIVRRPSAEIESVLGYVDEAELIHRDNLVLLA